MNRKMSLKVISLPARALGSPSGRAQASLQAHRAEQQSADGPLVSTDRMVCESIARDEVDHAHRGTASGIEASRELVALSTNMNGDVNIGDVISGNGRELPVTAEAILDELQERCLADACVTCKDCQVPGELVAHRAARGVEPYRLDTE